MKKLFAISAGAVVILGATSYFSPYLTLYQMKSAIEKRDPEAFSAHVDFPALRESVKDQMLAVINKQIASMPEDKNSPISGAAGKAMAAAFIVPMIDAAVTPTGVIAMMQAGGAKGGGKAGAAGAGGAAEQKAPDFSVTHEGWNKAVVRRAGDKKEEGGFIFKRDGVWSWKLAAVDMPASLSDTAK